MECENQDNQVYDGERLMSAGFVMRGQADNVATAADAIEDILRYYKCRLVYRKVSTKKLWVMEGDEKLAPPKISELVRMAAAASSEEEIQKRVDEKLSGMIGAAFSPVPIEETEELPEEFPEPVTEQVVKEIKKRGRPKGSKNKPRVVE